MIGKALRGNVDSQGRRERSFDGVGRARESETRVRGGVGLQQSIYEQSTSVSRCVASTVAILREAEFLPATAAYAGNDPENGHQPPAV